MQVRKSWTRTFALILMIALMVGMLPVTQAQAATTHGTFSMQDLPYSYQFTSSYPAPFGNITHERTWHAYYIDENGSGNIRQTYCIQYGTSVSTGSSLTYEESYSSLSATQKTLLNKALIFGYNEMTGTKYGGTWQTETMATQAMIWIIVNGQYGTSWESRIADVMLSDSSSARNIYNTMRSNLEALDTIPSFAGSSTSTAPEHELKYNMTNGKYELTLTDSNNVLKYFDFSASGVSFTRSGNKLTISTSNVLESLVVRANKNLPKEEYPTLMDGSPEYWTHGTWQDLVSLNVSGTFTVPAVMKLSTERLGNIKLVKTSEDGIVSGLKFRITGNGLDQTVTTGSDGTFLIEKLVAGSYTISEVDTPNRYVVPQSQTITVVPDKTTTVTFNNILKKFYIYITKTDAETGGAKREDTDATLSGAVYEIYDAKGNLVETVTAEGSVAKSKLLVLGTYTVKEKTPPTGYNLNPNPVTVTGDFDGQMVEIGRADTGIQDTVIKGQVSLVKFIDAPLTGDTEDGGIKTPLEDVTFVFTLKSTGYEACRITTNADGYAITPLLPYGVYRVEELQGESNDGYRLVEPFDVNIDTQSKIYRYIVENKVYKTDVKIIKTDVETGKSIPLAGTTFKIKDSAGNWVTQSYNYPTPTTIDEFQTAADGTLVLPEPLRAGDYWLFEVTAPYGYTVAAEPVKFTVSSDNQSVLLEIVAENQPVKGTVTVEKLGEYLTGFEETEHDTYGSIYTPIYKVRGVPGTVYDVVAVTDIVTPDGTIRAEAGSVVATLTTGSDGRATSPELYLGQYQLIEQSVPVGFVLDDTPIPFELTYIDQDTAIVTENEWVQNERQKAAVTLNKDAETVENQSYDPYGDITFGLYNAAEFTNGKGDTVLEKDSLLEIVTLDETGTGIIQTDLPFADYYVKELTAGSGYYLNENAYAFTLEHTDTDIPVVEIAINDGEPIPNELMRGSLRITKTAEDGNVEGISFRITGTSVNGTPYEKEYETDERGMIEITGLPIGEYEVMEIVNEKTVGYIRQDSQMVTVAAGDTSEISFENRLIRGGVKLIKTDAEGNRLNGAVFGLYQNGGELLQEFTVMENGEYTIDNLLYGSYYLLEHSAPEGYELSDAPYPFTISTHGETVEITAVNEKTETPVQPTPTNSGKGDSPKTGDDSNILFPVLLLIAAGAGITAAMWKRRKGKKQ